MMGDGHQASPKTSYGDQSGECETVWLLRGPPFDCRDYMVSPSETATVVTKDETGPAKATKFGPWDIKLDSKYVLDSRQALDKLAELVRSDCTQLFLNRVKELISKYLQGQCSGYPVNDLPFVIEIVEHFARKKDSNPTYGEFVVMLMCPSNNPPVTEKSSDILHSAPVLVDYFTLLGELLATFDEESFQVQLLETLECLVFRRKVLDVRAVKLSHCVEAMESSQLPYVVASLMETVAPPLYIYYLNIAIQLTLVSLKAGHAMVRANILDFVLRRLNWGRCIRVDGDIPRTDAEEAALNEYYAVLEKSSYLLWGLLSIVRKCDPDVPVPGDEALWSLKVVFECESVKKTKKAVSTRNNLAGLLVKLCGVFGDRLSLFQSGLVVDVAVVAVATEMGVRDTWLECNPLGTTKEDYVLKKLMLLCCCLIPRNRKSIEVLRCSKVIEGTLCLINPRVTAPWIPSQYLNLFFTALKTLSELIPILPDVYVLANGNAKFFSAVNWFVEQNFGGESLLELLKTLCHVTTFSNCRCIIDDMIARDGTKCMLDLCHFLLKIDCIKMVDQEKLSRAFILLERMCKDEPAVLDKHAESIVSVAVAFLKRVVNNIACDSKWNPNLLLGFGGFLWESVAWRPASVDSFVEQNGIFFLLDFIEAMSFPIQMLFLGIVVDMTDGGKTISHLVTWRGKNGYGILDLLIEIWRREECLTKVRRTRDGLIHDVEMPLMTQEQWYVTHQMKGSHTWSPAVAEMVCSARPKIYALYQFLQKRYHNLTSLSENEYALYINRVRSPYQVYFPLIENFLSLKMGEIWFEVIRDMSASGVLPTSFDGDTICTLLDDKTKWAARIKTLQEEILLSKRGGCTNEEAEYYKFLKSCRLSSALEALSELDYVARTSLRRFQEERKEKQIQDVEKSLKGLNLSRDVEIHRMYLRSTKATCLSGNYVRIKSEVEIRKPEMTFLFSSESSDENETGFHVDDDNDHSDYYCTKN